MDDAELDSVCHESRTDDRAAIIIEPDKIMMTDAACLGVSTIDPGNPVVPPAYTHSMFVDIVDEAILTVLVRMEAITRVRRNQLKREALG